MKDSTLIRYVRYAITIFVLLIIWIAWSKGVNNELIAPGLKGTFRSLMNILGDSKSYQYVGGTLLRLIASVLLSVLAGIILGFLSGIFYRLEQYLYPIVTMLRTIPVIALILVIWMAVGSDKSPIVITFLILFPLTYQAIIDGMKELNKNEFMDVYKLDSKLNLRVIFQVYLPLLFSYIRLALIQSFGLGVKVLVMAEFTAGTRNSIGLAILKANNAIEYSTIFAWTIVLIIFVLCIEFLVDLAKKKIAIN